jgi:hypothetical protein
LVKVRVRGRLAWFIRRTYYLLQMPGWTRRLRIVIDWTFALLFRPDIVKIGLDSEVVAILREQSQTSESSTAMPEVDRHNQNERPSEVLGNTNEARAPVSDLTSSVQ